MEAHRLWASEIAGAKGVTEAGASELAIRNVTTRFEEDIERLDAALKVYQQEGTTLKRGEVNQDNYRIRLFHFEQAISSLESLEDKEHREIAEALILSQAIPGVTYGLYTIERGSGGILSIKCTLRTMTPIKVYLTTKRQSRHIV